MKSLLWTGAFAAAMLGATAAFAAPAIVTTGLNLRTGPGTGYGAVATMPYGAVVDVRGCISGYNWCRVNWNGYDGWASGGYLQFNSGRYIHRSYSGYGAAFGVPLIAGTIISTTINNHRHYDRNYGHRPSHHTRPPVHHARPPAHHARPPAHHAGPRPGRPGGPGHAGPRPGGHGPAHGGPGHRRPPQP